MAKIETTETNKTGNQISQSNSAKCMHVSFLHITHEESTLLENKFTKRRVNNLKSYTAVCNMIEEFSNQFDLIYIVHDVRDAYRQICI